MDKKRVPRSPCVFCKGLNFVGVECNIVYAYIRTRLKLGGEFEAEKMRKSDY